MTNAGTRPPLPVSAPSQIAEPAAWLAILATGATILLLVALQVLSPEFSPFWRVISEYAFGHHPWVLSLMFLSWGISSWALGVAIWSQVRTNAGKVGLSFLIIAGIGEAMASVFDIMHEAAHDRRSPRVCRLPDGSLAAERCSGSPRNAAHGTKRAALDRKPKLDQRCPAHGDTGNHDDANGADQWRPFA
jgi:hypothetical protein